MNGHHLHTARACSDTTLHPRLTETTFPCTRGCTFFSPCPSSTRRRAKHVISPSCRRALQIAVGPDGGGHPCRRPPWMGGPCRGSSLGRTGLAERTEGDGLVVPSGRAPWPRRLRSPTSSPGSALHKGAVLYSPRSSGLPGRGVFGDRAVFAVGRAARRHLCPTHAAVTTSPVATFAGTARAHKTLRVPLHNSMPPYRPSTERAPISDLQAYSATVGQAEEPRPVMFAQLRRPSLLVQEIGPSGHGSSGTPRSRRGHGTGRRAASLCRSEDIADRSANMPVLPWRGAVRQGVRTRRSPAPSRSVQL